MIAAVAQIYPRTPRSEEVPTRPSFKERAARCRASASGLCRALQGVAVSLVTWLETSKGGRCLLCFVVVVGFHKARSAWLDSRRAAECERIVQAIEEYRIQHGRYPASLKDIDVTHDPELFDFSDFGVSQNPEGAYLELEKHELLGRHRWDYDFRRRVWIDYYD